MSLLLSAALGSEPGFADLAAFKTMLVIRSVRNQFLRLQNVHINDFMSRLNTRLQLLFRLTDLSYAFELLA